LRPRDAVDPTTEPGGGEFRQSTKKADLPIGKVCLIAKEKKNYFS
jgi:hypothetical protein